MKMRSIKILLELILLHLRTAFEDSEEEFEMLDTFFNEQFEDEGYRWGFDVIKPREKWLIQSIKCQK